MGDSPASFDTLPITSALLSKADSRRVLLSSRRAQTPDNVQGHVVNQAFHLRNAIHSFGHGSGFSAARDAASLGTLI
jgi:hypothetical protein